MKSVLYKTILTGFGFVYVKYIQLDLSAVTVTAISVIDTQAESFSTQNVTSFPSAEMAASAARNVANSTSLAKKVNQQHHQVGQFLVIKSQSGQRLGIS